MRGLPGTIVEFTDKEGKVQRGIVYKHAQHKEVSNTGRVVIHGINEDFSPKYANDKQIIFVKQVTLLKAIGKVD